MYEVTVKKQFAAAHRLLDYPDRCSRLHGHSWVVEVTVSGVELDENGMLIDFKTVKKLVGEVIDGLDHQYLNELEVFSQPGKETNPTAENLARYIFNCLRDVFKNGLKLTGVRVWESSDTCAFYSEGR